MRNCHRGAGNSPPGAGRSRPPSAARYAPTRRPGRAALRWRSGLTRTTSHASPQASKPRMTSADGSSCQRPRAVARRGRECVVVVVPGLAEGGQREPEHVARLVRRAEPPATEDVADRVDAERDVMQDEEPHRAAPQQPRQPGADGPADRHAEPERHRETGERSQHERAVDEADRGVGEEVRRVPRPGSTLVVAKQPAHVGAAGRAARRPSRLRGRRADCADRPDDRRTHGACGDRPPTRWAAPRSPPSRGRRGFPGRVVLP
jgi:hypothetical protein